MRDRTKTKGGIESENERKRRRGGAGHEEEVVVEEDNEEGGRKGGGKKTISKPPPAEHAASVVLSSCPTPEATLDSPRVPFSSRSENEARPTHRTVRIVTNEIIIARSRFVKFFKNFLIIFFSPSKRSFVFYLYISSIQLQKTLGSWTFRELVFFLIFGIESCM